mmetsp:Transcript_3654/g.7944  ORF Transcript_3654/g.7944 Transcript_3654/m.7944 type:complete len:246 (-) Transcript_3654:58-795(-)
MLDLFRRRGQKKVLAEEQLPTALKNSPGSSSPKRIQYNKCITTQIEEHSTASSDAAAMSAAQLSRDRNDSSAGKEPILTSETVPAPVPIPPTRAGAKVTYGCIDFRQHETVMCTPQGGMSTIPRPSLGRVTEYTDHDSLDVDAYEDLRAPHRRKIDAPKSTMRGSKKRQSLEVLRSKAMKEQAGKGQNQQKQKQKRSASLEIFSFRRLSSSFTRTRKRMAKRISSLTSTGKRRRTADSAVQDNQF